MDANPAIHFEERGGCNVFTDCIDFGEAEDEGRRGDLDDKCHSNVGKLANIVQPQDIHLPDWCAMEVGNIAHEVGHALGLFHEHQRPDRAAYVTVTSTDAANFGIPQDGVSYLEYDYDSIMHYSPSSELSIVGDAGGIVIGQNNHLSARDVAGIRAMYPMLRGHDVVLYPAQGLQLIDLTGREAFSVTSSVYTY